MHGKSHYNVSFEHTKLEAARLEESDMDIPEPRLNRFPNQLDLWEFLCFPASFEELNDSNLIKFFPQNSISELLTAKARSCYSSNGVDLLRCFSTNKNRQNLLVLSRSYYTIPFG